MAETATKVDVSRINVYTPCGTLWRALRTRKLSEDTHAFTEAVPESDSEVFIPLVRPPWPFGPGPEIAARDSELDESPGAKGRTCNGGGGRASCGKGADNDVACSTTVDATSSNSSTGGEGLHKRGMGGTGCPLDESSPGSQSLTLPASLLTTSCWRCARARAS